MSQRLNQVKDRRLRRAHRVRTTLAANSNRPRLSVTISNKHISAQVIDDTNGRTVVSVSTLDKGAVTGTMTEKATWVGTEIAKKAVAAKVSTVVLDRGGKLYHGRVKALAEAARDAGLEV